MHLTTIVNVVNSVLMPVALATPRTTDLARRRRLLEASLLAFTRHGYRKTSMAEVARAAGLSRQALYLHFAAKEELFRAAVRHALEGSLRDAALALADPTTPVEARLARGLDTWVGRSVGLDGGQDHDLVEASQALTRPMVAEHEELFVEAVARTLRASGLALAYKPAGLTPRQLADTLVATARGLKHAGASRPAFVEAVGLAVRAFCLPLGTMP